jgi:hypothetical protein
MSSHETDAIILAVRSTGLPHRITDINTPGVHSATGLHYAQGTGGQGRAVDVAGPIPYGVDPVGGRAAMLAICHVLEPFEHLVAELICSHLPYSIKNGRRVDRYAIDDHWDHIHLGVGLGVFLVPLPAQRPEITIVPDDPNLPNLPNIKFFVPVINTTTGEARGYYIVADDGELHAFGPGAPFFGRSEVVAA